MSSRYTMIVGTKNWSTWSLRPWLALRATGVPFEEIVVPLRRPDTRDTIRGLSGADTVPVLLVAENGGRFIVFDSLAICETLAERHPEAGLWPADPAARAEARSISAAMHSGFAALRASLSMEFARRLPVPDLSPEVQRDIATIERFWEKALQAHGTEEGFLFGRFSIADCMFAPVVSRFRTYGIALAPDLKAYCERMFALPAMQDWLRGAQAEVDAGLI